MITRKIIRKKVGRGYKYYFLDRKPVKSNKLLNNIKKIYIPNNWNPVIIYPTQFYKNATGMDNILEVNYRITSTSIDSPMTEVSRSQYQGYSNKTAKGTPTSFFIQRFIDRTTMTIYLTPGAAQDGNKLNF